MIRGLILSGAKQVGTFGTATVPMINPMNITVSDIQLVNYCIDFKNNKTKYKVHLLYAETVNNFEKCDWVHADDWVQITNITENFKQGMLKFKNGVCTSYPFTIIKFAIFNRSKT